MEEILNQSETINKVVRYQISKGLTHWGTELITGKQTNLSLYPKEW